MDEKAWEDAMWPSGIFPLWLTPMDTQVFLLRWELIVRNEAMTKKHLYLIVDSIIKCDGRSLYGGSPLRRDFSFGKWQLSLLSWSLLTTRRMDFPLGQMPSAHKEMVSCSPMGAAWNLKVDKNGRSKSPTNDRTKWILKKPAIPFKSIRYKKGIFRMGY